MITNFRIALPKRYCAFWVRNLTYTNSLGPIPREQIALDVSTPTNGVAPNELSIEDITVLENRDRKYDTTIVDLLGCYIVQCPALIYLNLV